MNKFIIKEYYVVEGGDYWSLTYSVESRIREGWQPYGSLAVIALEGGGAEFFQPVVKYENTESKDFHQS